jgi:2-methylisocitrate lyase-like PEP mutase family enzyme
VSVLPTAGCPPVAELASLGVARISVGGAFAYTAYGAAVAAGRELLDHGTYGYWDGLPANRDIVRSAFSSQ